MKMIARLVAAAVLISGTQISLAYGQVDQSQRDFKVALVALAISVRCHKSFEDPEIVTAAREIMIYVLRNQGLDDPYSEADNIIATLDDTVLTKEQEAVFTKETCQQTKARLLSLMR